MSEYKIEPRASGYVLRYYVYKALGPWPFKNWSWGSVYDSDSRYSCEEWIRETQFTESPEGQRLKLSVEKENRKIAEKRLITRQKMAAQGWYWLPDRMCYINNKGEIRIEAL